MPGYEVWGCEEHAGMTEDGGCPDCALAEAREDLKRHSEQARANCQAILYALGDEYRGEAAFWAARAAESIRRLICERDEARGAYEVRNRDADSFANKWRESVAARGK